MHRIEQRVLESPRLRQLVLKTRRIWKPILYATLVPIKNLGLPFHLMRRKEIHVHFGCGRINDKRFTNVDAIPFPHVHLVTQSPLLRGFRRNSIDSLYGCHVFEHFAYAEQGKILGRWIAILKPGGLLRLSVPDFDKLCDRFDSAGRAVESIQTELMGAQNYPGNFHYAIFNREHLAAVLRKAGFVGVAEWHPRNERDWPKDYSWADDISLNLEARKPRAP
jgi:predicted SAM-dependent methyltransferase